jgi:hypothetical protein
MLMADDIQMILRIDDSIVFHKSEDGRNIFLRCSHLAPIRAGSANEALNFGITMTPNGKFTALIHWEDGYVEKVCNRVERSAMVEIIGGYFNSGFFELQKSRNQNEYDVKESCPTLYYKLKLLCELVGRRLNEVIDTIDKDSSEFFQGCDGCNNMKTLDCILIMAKIKRDMDKVFTLVAGGGSDLHEITFESNYSLDMIDEQFLIFVDEIAGEYNDQTLRMLWTITETKIRLRLYLQSIYVTRLYPAWASSHPIVTIRDILDIDDRIVVTENTKDKWIDLICNMAFPVGTKEDGHALMFRIHMKSEALFSFEIHWDKRDTTHVDLNETDSNERIKAYYHEYPLDTRKNRIVELMKVSASMPMLVLKLHTTCYRIEEEIAGYVGLIDLHKTIKEQRENFERRLIHLKLKESSKRTAEIEFDDLEKLLEMGDDEIDAAFMDVEEVRQSTDSEKARILKQQLFSVQHNPYDGQGKHKPSSIEYMSIQDMTSLRSDMNLIFSYVTDNKNKDSGDLIMLLDVSTKIIRSVAELLIDLSYHSEKFKDWIMKESSFLINTTIQLIYRELHDKEPSRPP